MEADQVVDVQSYKWSPSKTVRRIKKDELPANTSLRKKFVDARSDLERYELIVIRITLNLHLNSISIELSGCKLVFIFPFLKLKNY